MKYLLMVLLNAPLPTISMADQFYVTVEVDCSKKETELVVRFRGAWNEAGEIAIANLNHHSWYAQDLVSFSKHADGHYSIHKKTESSICLLGKDRFDVEISPKMAPGFHPEGSCATRIGAKVTIRLITGGNLSPSMMKSDTKIFVPINTRTRASANFR